MWISLLLLVLFEYTVCTQPGSLRWRREELHRKAGETLPAAAAPKNGNRKPENTDEDESKVRGNRHAWVAGTQAGGACLGAFFDVQPK